MIRRSWISLVILLAFCTLFVQPVWANPQLNGVDRDIWLPKTLVSGSLTEPSQTKYVIIKVNGREFLATLDDTNFSAEVDLDSGDNEIYAVEHLHSGEQQISNTIHLDLRLPDLPKARLDLRMDQDFIYVINKTEASAISASPVVNHYFSVRTSNPSIIELLIDPSSKEILFEKPSVDGEYYLDLLVTDAQGQQDRATTYFVVEQGEARLVDVTREHAAWIDEAVIYGVMPNNLGLFGFDSVIDHLDSLEKLGITTLWLSPIQDSLTFGHGYDLINYFEIRPHYGSKDDLRRLIADAHSRGMRVLMDVVPNHTAAAHPYYQDSLLNGPDSPYYDFYDRDGSGQATYYFDWDDLPNLNYDHPEVLNWVTESLMYWVREFDIDGYRVDAIWGVKERNPEFWNEFRAEVTRIKPDILLIAEASARDSYYATNGFDAAYDWTDKLGHWAWENVFEDPSLIVPRLRRALTNSGVGYHPDALIFRFLNNNDTDHRFITRYGVDMTRTAAALLLTLPGLPQIYTGQEVGAEFRPYYDNWPVLLDDVHGLFGYYQDLIRIRSNSPASKALQSKTWKPVTANSNQVFSFVRISAAGEVVLVALNFSQEELEVEIKIPEDFTTLTSTGVLDDLLNTEQIKVDHGASVVTVNIAPWQGRIMIGQ